MNNANYGYGTGYFYCALATKYYMYLLTLTDYDTVNFYAHLDTASKTLVGETMESMLTVPLSTPMDGLPGQSSIHRWQAAL